MHYHWLLQALAQESKLDTQKATLKVNHKVWFGCSRRTLEAYQKKRRRRRNWNYEERHNGFRMVFKRLWDLYLRLQKYPLYWSFEKLICSQPNNSFRAQCSQKVSMGERLRASRSKINMRMFCAFTTDRKKEPLYHQFPKRLDTSNRRSLTR